MHIGERIKARRTELRWSQRDLAEKMGYKNHSAIARTEAGQVDLPQSKVEQFAEVLGVTPGYLMGWVSKETAEKNDQLIELIALLRRNPDLFDFVVSVSQLSAEDYISVKRIVASLCNK